MGSLCHVPVHMALCHRDTCITHCLAHACALGHKPGCKLIIVVLKSVSLTGILR